MSLRTRLELTPLEDRTVPVYVVVGVGGLSDATEGGSAGSFRITRDASVGSTEVNVLISGTATPTSDYTAISSVITIPNGQTYVDVAVTPVNDSTAEATETVTLTLDDGMGYTVSGSSAATVRIFDNDAQAVSVAKISDTTQGGAYGVFHFTRIGDLSGALTANVTIGGTATSGTDYTGPATTVPFAVGSATADVNVAALHDGISDPSETVTLTVASGSGYTVGSPSNASLTITDDARPLVTAETIDDGREGGTNGKIRLTRSDYLTGSLTVYYSVGGDATEPPHELRTRS